MIAKYNWIGQKSLSLKCMCKRATHNGECKLWFNVTADKRQQALRDMFEWVAEGRRCDISTHIEMSNVIKIKYGTIPRT